MRNYKLPPHARRVTISAEDAAAPAMPEWLDNWTKLHTTEIMWSGRLGCWFICLSKSHNWVWEACYPNYVLAQWLQLVENKKERHGDERDLT